MNFGSGNSLLYRVGCVKFLKNCNKFFQRIESYNGAMIQLKGITKKFGSLTAVDNVSYSIGKGEYFALLGPNGAGKTTIVRMILGFSAPTAGTITLEGMPAADPAAHRQVGYLAENHRIGLIRA